MGSGYPKPPFAARDILGKPLGARRIAQVAVENSLQKRIPPGNSVPHDEQIRIEGQLLDSIALDQLDALGRQLAAHGRIDTGVAARHPVASLPRHQGDAAHEGAANAEDVDMHETVPWDKMGRDSNRRPRRHWPCPAASPANPLPETSAAPSPAAPPA